MSDEIKSETVDETKITEPVDPETLEQEPPDPVEEEPQAEPESQPEPEAKPEKKVVPEAVFLEEKRQRKELERRIAELESKSHKAEESAIGPTTIKELVEAGELAEDDIPTVKQLRMLEENREKKAQIQTRVSTQQTVAQAEAQFRASITQDQILSGLGVDDVCTSENAENLTGKDWKEFHALPVGSIQRAQFFYNKCIERTPELSKRLEQNKPKQTTKLPGTRTSIPQSRTAIQESIDDNDILSAVNKGMSEEEFFKSVGT